MADENKPLHGEPMHATGRTKEEIMDATLRVRMGLAFDLDLRPWGGPLIENVVPPARIIDRVATVLTKGPEALAKPPEHPQPNSAFGKLIPAPSRDEDQGGSGSQS